jgi:membrane-associated phospholipid phosphatase
MTDLSRPWPLGLGTALWWRPALVAAIVLAAAVLVDEPVSIWARHWPAPILEFMAAVTTLGLSDWILIPSAVLFVLTAGLARFARWRLMRTVLWQLTALYAFIFAGVGIPGLITLILKRIIGRGRPMHLLDTGLFGLKANFLDWDYQSFPSGHSTTIFAAAMVTGFISARLLYPALVVAAVVAISRIALGDHYPSDVVAGAIVGILGAYLGRWLFAQRGWMFVRLADGHIRMRATSSLTRLTRLKRRDIGRAPRAGQP